MKSSRVVTIVVVALIGSVAADYQCKCVPGQECVCDPNAVIVTKTHSHLDHFHYPVLAARRTFVIAGAVAARLCELQGYDCLTSTPRILIPFCHRVLCGENPAPLPTPLPPPLPTPLPTPLLPPPPPRSVRPHGSPPLLLSGR